MLAQDFTDWICELHNDDPDDSFPAQLLAELNDDRFILKNHQINLGGSGSFNLAFSDCTEKYASMLEDDNWWEPDFLSTMIEELEEHPSIEIAISNEFLWKEERNGTWTDLKTTVLPKISGVEKYANDLMEQCGSTKICNSAMVWRTMKSEYWLIPTDLPIDVTEHFRDRVIHRERLMVYKPLVNFAQTINTNRTSDPANWGSYQVLLIASIFKKISPELRSTIASRLLERARRVSAPYKTSLLHASFAERSARELFKQATLGEIFRYSLTWLKSPRSCYRIIQSTVRLNDHWQFLLKHTSAETEQ